MEEKYINFYKMFDKRFKNNKKSYSLFELNQSQWSKFKQRIKKGVDDGIELNHNLPTMCI